METYIGIADCHGIESMQPEKEAEQYLLSIRAMANKQRHALVYRVTLTKPQHRRILNLLNKGAYKLALLLIKELRDNGKLKNLSVQKGCEKSFELIPNSKLDPWG